MLTVKFIIALIEINYINEDDLNFIFECPDCSSIEDSDYFCTTCESSTLSYTSIIKALLSQNFQYEYSFYFNLKEILEYNEYSYSNDFIFIEKSEYKEFFYINDKEPFVSNYIEIKLSKIIDFLINSKK